MSLAAMLVAAVIGAVLLSGSAGDAAPRSAPAVPWNTTDIAYAQAMLWHQQQAMLWHQQQAEELASLVQGGTTRRSCCAWRSASAPPGAPMSSG